MRDTRSTWIRPGSNPPLFARPPGPKPKRAPASFRGGRRNPYRLVIGFAAAAEARGARLFERTEVTKVTFDRVRATVVTPNGRIVTPQVVHCTGEPTGLVAALKRHFRWDVRSLVLTDVLPVAVRKAIGPPRSIVCDTDTPPHTIRWTADHRVLVGGADSARPKGARAANLDVQRTGQLMYELSRLYPDISGVMPAYGWSVPLAHSVDGGLYVGPHRNFPHQLFAFGTAHDPARAFLASRILLRHRAGHDDQRRRAFRLRPSALSVELLSVRPLPTGAPAERT